MRKALRLLTAAALVAGTALPGSVTAQERSRRAELPANQMADQAAARVARIKADLRLTPEQEGNWADFETALRDISKTRADREIALRADRTQPKGPVDIIEQMRRGADALSECSTEQKKLADAAQPLFASLSEQQKRRLTEELVRLGGALERQLRDYKKIDRGRAACPPATLCISGDRRGVQFSTDALRGRDIIRFFVSEDAT